MPLKCRCGREVESLDLVTIKARVYEDENGWHVGDPFHVDACCTCKEGEQ